MAKDRLTTYAELAQIVDVLPLLTKEARRGRGLSLRDAAAEIGTGFNTLTRFEHGANVNLSNAVKILRWLDRERVINGGTR